MKSTITTYYDYRSEPLPEELTRWRIPDNEIQEQLAAISRAHAQEIKVETVELWDAVRCSFVDGSSLPDRESALLYPGMNLPGAEPAEGDVIGKHVGDVLNTMIGGTALTLRVEEIRRRCPAEINDELVKSEHIDGVKTVNDFARWYQEKNEPARKYIAKANIASYWMQLVEKKSELSIDLEERLAWAMRHARQRFDSLVAAGIDPCIPEEGFDFLTEEQALQQMADELLNNYNLVVAVRGIAHRKGIVLDETWLEERYQQIAEFENISLEQAKAKEDSEMMLEREYGNRIHSLLADEAEQFLEV